VSFSDIDCARAREAVSAQLDGELPELDADRLETHLLLCPDCSAWSDQMREVTTCLRDAVLEVPAERVAWTRHRRGLRVSSAVALASAAAVVATMFFTPGHRGLVGSRDAAAVARSVRPAGSEVGDGQVLEDGLFVAVSVNSQHESFQPV
jgi:predicted anti-sigma-YlaC factor YlaD